MGQLLPISADNAPVTLGVLVRASLLSRHRRHMEHVTARHATVKLGIASGRHGESWRHAAATERHAGHRGRSGAGAAGPG